MKYIVSLLVIIIIVMGMVGCSPKDPLLDDLYTSNIFPHDTDSYDLGSDRYRWDEIYGDAIYAGTLYSGGYPVPDVNYAEMYRHESAAVTTIQEVNDWHLLNGFTTGAVGGGWAFHAGCQLAITAYADNGDGKTLVTVVAHILINGDVISISNTTSYDGIWQVEQATVNTFVIDVAFVADDGASTGEHGSHFQSEVVTSAGRYLITYSLSLRPLSPNCVVEVAAFYNTLQCIKCESQTKLGAVDDFQNVAGHSVLVLAVGDIVSMGIRNITDGGDFLIRNGNMTLAKLGNIQKE